ncbi:ferredoxin [Nocardia miyunensis]|uniref:ferredoxin n=1 Tax=Nocardia miyunensis TaxID=282684 RepID=UPI000834CEEE|nr:ferredoxin [Nocardia miyunensis]
MHIEVDRDKCIASGACVFAAPAIFDQDDDGIVLAIVADPTPEQEAGAAAGIRACPAAAIRSE